MESIKYIGIVIWFNNKKGFGFIQWYADGLQQKDMFVHWSDILTEGYKSLKPGQEVQFEVGTNNHNDPKAINVKILTN